jgi:hypothetical protein
MALKRLLSIGSRKPQEEPRALGPSDSGLSTSSWCSDAAGLERGSFFGASQVRRLRRSRIAGG